VSPICFHTNFGKLTSCLDSELPQMMVHLKVGVAHALGPRHVREERTRPPNC
jgi:hypothetical protein